MPRLLTLTLDHYKINLRGAFGHAATDTVKNGVPGVVGVANDAEVPAHRCPRSPLDSQCWRVQGFGHDPGGYLLMMNDPGDDPLMTLGVTCYIWPRVAATDP